MAITDVKTLNEQYDLFLKTYDQHEPFIYCDDRILTIKDLNELTSSYIVQLKNIGIRAGACVGYTMPNCPEIVALVIALSKIGACAVPVFHMVPDMAKAGIFKNSRVALVVTTASQKASLKDCANKVGAEFRIVTLDNDGTADEYLTADNKNDEVELTNIDASAPVLISSSSGTTGIPKAVMWQQSNAGSLIKASMAMAEPITQDGKIGSSVVAFPLASAGLVNLLGFMFAGVRLIFSSDVSPVKFIQMLQKYQPDSMAAPPAYY